MKIIQFESNFVCKKNDLKYFVRAPLKKHCVILKDVIYMKHVLIVSLFCDLEIDDCGADSWWVNVIFWKPILLTFVRDTTIFSLSQEKQLKVFHCLAFVNYLTYNEVKGPLDFRFLLFMIFTILFFIHGILYTRILC